METIKNDFIKQVFAFHQSMLFPHLILHNTHNVAKSERDEWNQKFSLTHAGAS